MKPVASFKDHLFERDKNQSQTLRFLMKELAKQFIKEGYSVSAYTEASWAQFDKMSSDQKDQTYRNFLSYYAVCEEAVNSGDLICDSQALLWRMIKKLGLRPSGDLFNKISDGDVIEIYNKDFIQTFRNLRFFEISSYSIAEIFFYEWRHLYYRDNEVTQQIAARAIEVFTGQSEGTQDVSSIPEHYLIEEFSEGKNKMLMQEKFFSPLFDSHGEIQALVATSTVDVVASGVEKALPKSPKLELVK